MVTVLECPSNNSQEGDSLYHLEHSVSKTEDVETQQNENKDRLIAFRDTQGHNPRPILRSLGACVQPNRIAGSSSTDNLNHRR